LLLLAACSSASKASGPIGPVYYVDGGSDVATDHVPDAHFSFDVAIDHGSSPVDAGRHDAADATAPKDSGKDVTRHDAPVAPVDAVADVVDSSMVPGSDASDAKAASMDASLCPNGMGTLALLGGTSTLGFGAASTNGGTWKITSFADQSVSAPPAVVPLATGFVGVFTSATTVIESTDLATSTGSWSAPAPLTAVADMDGAATEQGAPSLVALGSNAELVYYGSNSYFYHGVFANGMWGAASDPVGGTTSKDFGPSQPTAAGSGSTLFVGWDGMNGMLYVDTWTSAAGWAGANAVDGASVGLVPPTMIALTGGANDLMLVYEQASTNFLYSVVHTPGTGGTGAGTWSPPVAVGTSALATTAVALAPIANGGVAMVYEGSSNGVPYAAVYDPTATPAWTTPVNIYPGSLALKAAPTIASGACGVDAIAALVETTAVAIVTLKSGVWAPPVLVNDLAGMSYATIAATQ
jgi:hypothetical protein